MDISLDRQTRYLGIIPKVIFKEKGSYAESSTKEYDRLAFKYLSWVLFPLLGAYAVYSLVYEEHKGWYSWVLNMLYGFLLMFGEYPLFCDRMILLTYVVFFFFNFPLNFYRFHYYDSPIIY